MNFDFLNKLLTTITGALKQGKCDICSQMVALDPDVKPHPKEITGGRELTWQFVRGPLQYTFCATFKPDGPDARMLDKTIYLAGPFKLTEVQKFLDEKWPGYNCDDVESIIAIDII